MDLCSENLPFSYDLRSQVSLVDRKTLLLFEFAPLALTSLNFRFLCYF